MGRGNRAAQQFADAFRGELDRQRLGVRTLARRRDPHNLDRERRNLHRWLSGQHLPALPVRYQLADELGVARSTFEVDADDEEAAQLMSLPFPDFMATLVARAVAAALATQTSPALSRGTTERRHQ